MKINKYIGMMMTAVLVLTASSCTDFDDYNKVPVDANASSELTLWDNISQNSRLTNFQKIIQKVGFNNELQQSHFYTVWAPVNGSFDYDVLNTSDSSRLLRQFVQNHIARYNYPASGNLNQKVYMLNEKLMHFQGDGTYGTAKQSRQSRPLCGAKHQSAEHKRCECRAVHPRQMVCIR